MTMLDLKDTLASVPLDDQGRQEMFEAEVRKRDVEPEVFDVQTPLMETMPVRNVRVSILGQNQKDDPFYVTAHHDCVKAGRGVVDNWSGVVALLELIDRLNDRPLNRPVRLMSFAYEEAGPYGCCVGSDHFLRFNCNEMVFANINLECLGPSPLHFWTYDAALVPGDVPESPYWGMPSDAARFHQHGHPSIVFDGISASPGQIIHTARDNIDAIDMDRYRKSLDQLEGYLRYLDSEG
jgi:Zn-dependent M28 family amino/carboxypeptidase